MILTHEGTTYRGRALDLRAVDLDGESVVAAIRGQESGVTVDAQAPGELHERIGHVRPGMGLSTRTALAVAARSRGYATPQDEKLAAVETELANLSCPPVSTRQARKAASQEGTETARLRERVAELRGRL
ncbi:MAG: hypothetical protein ABEI77_10075 [Halorientalis sp.]